MLDGYDWEEALAFAKTEHCSAVAGYTGSVNGWTRDDIARVIASMDGDNDGPSWIAIVELKDGRFSFLEASCDNTGWD